MMDVTSFLVSCSWYLLALGYFESSHRTVAWLSIIVSNIYSIYRSFAGLKNLKVLNLAFNNITDACLAHLKGSLSLPLTTALWSISLTFTRRTICILSLPWTTFRRLCKLMNFTTLAQWIALSLSIKHGNCKTFLLLKLVAIDLAFIAHSEKCSDLILCCWFETTRG